MSDVPPPIGHPGRPSVPPPGSTPPPPPGPPPGTSAEAVTTPPRRSTTTIVVAIVAAFVVLAGAIVAVVALTRDSAEAGEVFLEGASSPGTDPFTTQLKGEAVAVTTTTASTTTTTAAGKAPVLATASGGQPGLYGGSKDNGRCDPTQQIEFLKNNPAIAQAFVNALNRDPTLRWAGGTRLTVAQIPDYFKELTPVTLMSDTRVTNYGYNKGNPTPRQAVLQAGTSVLVDRYGVPRVKCNCGNPLTQPTPVRAKPRYTGTQWPGFNPTTIIVVNQTNIEINVFVLTNVEGSGTIERPAGTSGSKDTQGAGDTTTSPTSTSTTTSTTTGSTTSTTSGAGPTGDSAAYCDQLRAEVQKYRGLDPTVPEIVAVFDRLVELAPPDIRPATVTLRDALARAAAAGQRDLSMDDPAVEAAANQWMAYATGTCGITPSG